MQTYELTVSGRSISASTSNRTLVRTSIGVDQIHVLFDSAEWLEFPIEVTFGQGDDKVTQPVVMSAIQGSQDWAAETTATVPWEVVDDNGSIAVTFQGTDSQGRHLITAKGAPLRVTEAGDVVAGGEPSDAPSVSEWQQAYADAMAAVNQAASLVANLQQSLESMVSEAEGAISSAVEEAEQSMGSIQPATAESLGVVRIGEGIDVDQNGVISTSGGSGMTDAQRTDLARLKSLSAAIADATYSGSSVTGSPKVKPSALPVANITTPGAVIPDGTTIRVDQYGMIHSYVGTIEPATTEFVGGVKPDGTTITIDQDGTIHAASAYTLPDATTTQKGGVIVGDGIKVSGGKISVPAPDWNADQGEDGYIANRPFYDTKQWVQVASGIYGNTSGMKVGDYYLDRYSRWSYTDGGFDPTLPARLTFDGRTYDMAFSRSGASWVSYSEDLVYQIQASQSGNRWALYLRCSTPNVPDTTYVIQSCVPVVTKLPQKYVDYSPCSPAIGDTEMVYVASEYAYMLTLNGSKYQRLRVRDLISQAIVHYQATLDTDSQTVAGAINELHDDVASLATPEYVNEQTSSLASSIASLARRVEAIERKLGISPMSYEDGTLYVSGTYEDGTLVTGAAYQDGTLL